MGGFPASPLVGLPRSAKLITQERPDWSTRFEVSAARKIAWRVEQRPRQGGDPEQRICLVTWPYPQTG